MTAAAGGALPPPNQAIVAAVLAGTAVAAGGAAVQALLSLRLRRRYRVRRQLHPHRPRAISRRPSARADASLLARPGGWAAGAVAAISVTLIAAPAAAPVVAATTLLGPGRLRRLHHRRMERRATRFLPELLEAMGRALRSGGSLAQAIAEAPPPPDAPAFAERWDRTAGLVPVVGVAEAATRWRNDAATSVERLAAASVALAAEVGGPQARAADAAATAIRDRIAVEDELVAQSAQAYASAMLIAAAPVAFAVLAAAIDPRFVPFLFRTVPGALLLHAGLGLDALGLWWMARLVRRGAP